MYFCNLFIFFIPLYAYYVVLFHVRNKDNINNSLFQTIVHIDKK